MSDYFQRRDIQSVTTFTDPNALFDFGFEAPQQSVLNESSDTTYELSWDGINVHGQLKPTGPTNALGWDDHSRKRVYVRRQQGSGGGGGKFVQVLAATR